ncbi:hypothetical protein X975_05798, partial [Stegodyphus mimosarum]
MSFYSILSYHSRKNAHSIHVLFFVRPVYQQETYLNQPAIIQHSKVLC